MATPEELEKLKRILLELIDTTKTKRGQTQLWNMYKDVDEAYRWANECRILDVLNWVDLISGAKATWDAFENPDLYDILRLERAARDFYLLLNKILEDRCGCKSAKP
jgi:hypothetical protein